MPRNGTGGYSLPSNSWNPAINGVAATAADWQALINDVATAIQQSVSRDGQTTMTGSLNMGGFVVTGLGAPVGVGQSLRWEQLTKGADIASASTLAIPNEGALFDITGTTTITAFSGSFPGRVVYLRFAAGLQITNSASLVMPNGVNLYPYPGDVFAFCNTDASTWACVGAVNRLPLKHRSGGTLTHTNTTVTVSPGAWRSAGDETDIILPSAITKTLQTTGSWTPGSGQNGLFTGAAVVGTWYHLFVIKNTTTGAVDAGFDTSVTAANIPAGYVAYRRVGAVQNTAGNIIRAFTQFDDFFQYVGVQVDINNTGLGNNLPTNVAMTCPLGVQTEVAMLSSMIPPGAGTFGIGFSTPGTSAGSNSIITTSGQAVEVSRVSNTSRQITIQANNSTFGSGLYVFTRGYRDFIGD